MFCHLLVGEREINYRDYESFLSGSVLIKPDMDHVDTWPNYYLKKSFILTMIGPVMIF